MAPTETKKTYKRVKTPTLIQMEAVECGAAALGIVLGYYGLYITLEELRAKCGVSRDGSKASNVLKAARGYNMEAKGYKYESQLLRNVPVPAIIHWNFNHFLVLEGFSGGKVYLNDPAEGPRTVTEEEFNESYTGIVLTFQKTAGFKKGGNPKRMMAALLKRLPGAKLALTYSILAGLFLVIPGLVIPIFSKVFIDNILIGKMEGWLRPLLIGMTVTAILRAILTALQQHYLAMLEIKLAITTSSKFFWHVLHLPVEFFAQRYAGDLSSRLSSNEQVASLLSGQLATNALNCVLIIFYAALMFQYDVTLTLVGVTIALLNIITLKIVSRQRVDQNQKMLQTNGKFYSDAMSGLSIIETLKASGAESDFFARWAGLHANVVCAEQDMQSSNQILSNLPPLLSTINNALILGIGGFKVMEGQITMGMLVAFQSLMSSFIGPVNTLLSLGSSLQELEGSMNRLDDVSNYPRDKRFKDEDNISASNTAKLSGHIELRGVTFGYSRLEAPLIENFNLKLLPGMRVALVGSSGSGKSTVAKLVSGLYEPWSGEILFDGKTRNEIPNTIVTNSVAMVDQDITIFNGTITENITLWDETIPASEVIRAAKDASIHEDLVTRHSSYDSNVEEGGKNFSGGQRQRLEISRALAINPTTLVLDEATSALDPQTEKLVDECIRGRGCTCVIVAHRLSTIRDCDEIIVMEYGKIVERGTHEELKNAEGAYSRLINMS